MAKHNFLLPDVGEGLEGGAIVQWLVAEGDSVSADQIIVEIETDKAVVEIPAPVTGTLTTHGAAAGATLSVGDVLATFEVPSDNTAPTTTSEPTPDPKVQANASVAATPSTQTAPPNRTLASPATRKFAREHAVDLTLITGSGSRGQITRADVEAHMAQSATATASQNDHAPAQPTTPSSAAPPLQTRDTVTEPLTGLRKQIAVNMQQAWSDIPHIFTFEEIDASQLVHARQQINAEFETQGTRISFLPFFVKACVVALQEHPRFNASLSMQDETVTYHGQCNIGIATATPEGLIVTVVHEAEKKSLQQIASEIESLADLARRRRVTVEQIRGGTFTISNFGSYGGTLGTPIIRPPEVAIAGFGRIHDKVVPIDGQPAVRKILPIAISTDHRLNDGEHLGGFVATLTRLLANPVRLLGHL
jgi:pyruvate/2-oxoglutarate dehydrogenase complex dihydrolipoamide acyltransferase (E2) component